MGGAGKSCFLLKVMFPNGSDDHVNWREIATGREGDVNFGFEYCSVHVNVPECECLELICIMESHCFGMFPSLC